MKKNVFEPKCPFSGVFKTNAIPLSHTACLNIGGSKSYSKNSPVCLDLAYFQPNNKQKNNFLVIFVSSLHFIK